MISFHSAAGDYCLFLLVLLFATRRRTSSALGSPRPTLSLRAIPWPKRLGWRWGIPFNVAICFLLAFWPVTAVAVSTTSVLVAARNFQSAWLMRTIGENAYRDWHIPRIQETQISLYLFCLSRKPC